MKPLALSVQYALDDDDLPSRAQVRRWAQAACEEPLEITIRFVDSREAKALNKQYRQGDYVPNVLAFPYPAAAGVTRGDVVICPSIVRREAKAQRKTVHAHFAHMVIHGVLHVQGYEHNYTLDTQTMEAREIALLRRFRIANPYE